MPERLPSSHTGLHSFLGELGAVRVGSRGVGTIVESLGGMPAQLVVERAIYSDAGRTLGGWNRCPGDAAALDARGLGRTETDSLCKNLQDFREQAATWGFERP